ncbi:hypothetical protein CAOG_03958 [Capsaspora owczarzaki ATCC 30864]|uniref:Uncharacterized protein n=1 Tax=Capsaspora owczarzaki (strain ATCC 30864) TaxID=595528 RepID=A0A0D2VQV7_CAPO3|nr:hypothetical protein CAOG_03958 [Capsaspora owczarzaki ATCC 30864]KJE93127.1 hypothetical protein CAOG_003958 [Capsaspora owczarzaki ATCC 30864]|eukprot:XP_004363686.1 hypothetical protein CAOG_03958 [Capsaspora owczarzaki ATCC 30864]
MAVFTGTTSGSASGTTAQNITIDKTKIVRTSGNSVSISTFTAPKQHELDFILRNNADLEAKLNANFNDFMTAGIPVNKRTNLDLINILYYISLFVNSTQELRVRSIDAQISIALDFFERFCHQHEISLGKYKVDAHFTLCIRPPEDPLYQITSYFLNNFSSVPPVAERVSTDSITHNSDLFGGV